MLLKQAAYAIASFIVVIFVIALLWLVLWKFVLAPNPIVREFFDLDSGEKLAARRSGAHRVKTQRSSEAAKIKGT